MNFFKNSIDSYMRFKIDQLRDPYPSLHAEYQKAVSQLEEAGVHRDDAHQQLAQLAFKLQRTRQILSELIDFRFYLLSDTNNSPEPTRFTVSLVDALFGTIAGDASPGLVRKVVVDWCENATADDRAYVTAIHHMILKISNDKSKNITNRENIMLLLEIL